MLDGPDWWEVPIEPQIWGEADAWRLAEFYAGPFRGTEKPVYGADVSIEPEGEERVTLSVIPND